MAEYPDWFRKDSSEAIQRLLRLHHACLVVGMPGVGKSTFLRQLERFLGHVNDVVATVDLNELFLLDDYQGVFGLMARRMAEAADIDLDDRQAEPFEQLRHLLRQVTAGGKVAYLLLDRFEKVLTQLPVSFQDGLTSLISSFDGQLQVVMFVNDTTGAGSKLNLADQLASLVGPATFYLLPYSWPETEAVMNRFRPGAANLLARRVYQLSGGHSRLIRALISEPTRLDEPEAEIAKWPGVKLQCERISGTIRDDERPVLEKRPERLKRLGILTEENDEVVIFSPLLAEFLRSTREVKPFIWLDMSGALFINGEQRDDEFSAKEFELLKYLLAHPGEVVDRDQLAEAVWGEEGDVSNEAIDQLVSRARQKIGIRGREIVQTVFGRGYKLVA